MTKSGANGVGSDGAAVAKEHDADLLYRYYTAEQVALLIDPTGQIVKARSIRTDTEKGLITPSRFAGKKFYAQPDVEIYLQRVRECHAPTLVPTSFAPEREGEIQSSSSAGPKAGAIVKDRLGPEIRKLLKPSSRIGSRSAGASGGSVQRPRPKSG